MQYVWLIWSLFFLMFWIILYLSKPFFRKEMMSISLGTILLGFTEPLFVPEYWNPPTLFNLADRTGFDIESLIFTFAIGGIGSVLYRVFYKKNVTKMENGEMENNRHKFHIYILTSPIPIFLVLALFTELNHIYCGVIAMFVGALLTLYCRPDLKWKIWAGGLLFLIYYLVFFLSLITIFPNYVTLIWNLKALTEILFLGIPIEELMFAFSFGMLWSSLYEHILYIKNDKSGNSESEDRATAELKKTIKKGIKKMKINSCIFTIILSASFFFMTGCTNKKNNSEIQQRDTSAIPTKTSNRHNMEMMQSMNTMKDKMNGMKMTSDYDFDFAKMMIEHHKGAIDISEMELTSGTDSKMKTMAQNIITAQKDEILKMEEFIKKHTVVKSNHKMETMDAMDEKMKEMKMTGNTDKDFAMMMIIHHQIAVTMAEGEVSNGQHPEIKNMAQQMIADQNKEITELQSWIDNKK